MSTLSFDYYYGQESEQFIFYRIPKLLFTDDKFSELSIEAKVLYGIMLDRMGLSLKNKWLDEQKRVYIVFTIDKIMNLLHCREQKANKLLKDLEEIGLIERKRNGLGKPNFIYVKNFLGFYKKEYDGTKKTEETLKNSENLEKTQSETEYFSEQKQQNGEDLQQSQEQKYENSNSRNAIFTIQDFPKSQSINTPLINDTDFSDTGFNDTKKTNETVFINNNKHNPSYPSYLSSKEKQSEQQTDKIDEIDNIFYFNTEKKEEEKEKQECNIDKELEEIPYSYPKCLLNLERELAQEKLKEQQNHITNTNIEEKEEKPKQQFFIDKGLEEQMCRDTILRNIEYDFLKQKPSIRFRMNLVNNIVDIMVSVITSHKSTIRIGGEEIPQQMVKERFLKLDSEHIEYIVNCLENTKSKIHNIRAYYISTLYNAYETMEAYSFAEVNHKMYG